MNIRGTWFGLGIMVMLITAVGVSMLPAQRAPSGPGSSEVGRFVLIRATPDMIVIMDSTNGELYRATVDDLKPYYRLNGGSRDKDRAIKDKMPFPGVKDRPVPPKDFPPGDKDFTRPDNRDKDKAPSKDEPFRDKKE
jgi:hypothetical protein